MVNKYLGSSFESFLLEENILVDTEITAVKRVIAHQLSSRRSHQLLKFKLRLNSLKNF